MNKDQIRAEEARKRVLETLSEEDRLRAEQVPAKKPEPPAKNTFPEPARSSGRINL
ncbi:MAG: hypothetical protein Q8Q18_01610 [bacterium]|nr:hypothetical protein [bacterium]